MMPTFLQDRMPIAILETQYPELLEFISTEYPQSVKDKQTVHFCGVACPGNEQSFAFVPRGAPSGFLNCDARLTMTSLARYGQDVESRIGNDATEGGDSSLAATIQSIVQDYRRNGLYAQRLRIRSRDSGKPDWKRTLQRHAPLINREGTPIYVQLESSRFLNATENLLATIQAETLRDILSKHGWWTGLDKSVLSDVSEISQPDHAVAQYSAAIQRFKRLLFDDRSLALASLLEQYWDSEASQSAGSFICGVPDFSAVWEHMLKTAVNDVSSKWNARLPLPSYEYRDGRFKARTKGGIMDVVIESGNDLIVADAKYYRAQSTSTAPGFGDILKQSFYTRSLKSLAPDKTVRSYFVFPAWEKNGPLERAGFYERQSVKLTDWLETVDCVYVNLRELMENYTTRNMIDWLE